MKIWTKDDVKDIELPEGVGLNDVQVIGPLFSKEEMEEIIAWKDKYKGKEGTVGYSGLENTDIRKVMCYRPKEHIKWVAQRILDHVQKVNNLIWDFDIMGIEAEPALMEYKEYKDGEVAGHYDWHVDTGRGNFSSRKLSFSVILNTDYTGGDLTFFVGDKSEKIDKERAYRSLVLFPSYRPHKITPVRTGTRYTLVGWINGPAFR